MKAEHEHELDKARAEVERLRAALEQVWAERHCESGYIARIFDTVEAALAGDAGKAEWSEAAVKTVIEACDFDHDEPDQQQGCERCPACEEPPVRCCCPQVLHVVGCRWAVEAIRRA